jgi:hypothetical protein
VEEYEWYNKIELGVRDVVKLLRNNGINTECSCEHERYIQCAASGNGRIIQEIDTLLFNYGYRDYIIEYIFERNKGYEVRDSINIKFLNFRRKK